MEHKSIYKCIRQPVNPNAVNNYFEYLLLRKEGNLYVSPLIRMLCNVSCVEKRQWENGYAHEMNYDTQLSMLSATKLYIKVIKFDIDLIKKKKD
jgi:hypothetical protein